MRRLPFAALSLLAVAGCHGSSETVRFAYQRELGADRWIHVRNTNGNVTLLQSPDARVTVEGVATGNTRALRFVTDTSTGDLTVCAVRGAGDCAQAGRSMSGGPWGMLIGLLTGGTRPPTVAYRIWVPADARVEARTTNGGVRLESRAREFRAATVNGSIKGIAASEHFAGETINGSISVQLGILGDSPLIELKTVNGSVTAELPEAFAGQVALKTVNGRVSSDFTLGATDGAGAGSNRRPKSLSGTIGAGPARLSMESVNGSVRLHRIGRAASEVGEIERSRGVRVVGPESATLTPRLSRSP